MAEAPELAGASNSRNAGLFRAIFDRFRRFFVKMADETTSFPVFSLESNFSLWSVSKMTDILISYLGEFSRYSSILGRFGFFVKMAAKTISVSGFHLRFEFFVLDFIKNDIHIDRVGDFSRYRGSKFKNSKII